MRSLKSMVRRFPFALLVVVLVVEEVGVPFVYFVGAGGWLVLVGTGMQVITVVCQGECNVQFVQCDANHKSA